ncbi:DUF4339 domain-containing protein [Blastopirellula sp. JC732]|uniref:DUF4339 domain-containing protein n=1 Tax=Blastopirellula sediminis TaxID=2894196 RepID=A0A9X1SET4_9BACT|nr:DUF4339 domain-containing protein [Blastopirellula sediminis]MCC9609656.1 DUF4339 domain-containing protein [Blastopirellula sediminis]MCC9627568.1 DUF4339 domain-containing protein [Blastopirellula sediminis]
MSEYYIKIGGEQRGPFSRFQLESQPLSESTPVRQEGTDQWRRAGEFPELMSLFRGSGDDQYGNFRDVVTEPSPYASPQVEVHQPSGSTLPKVLGMVSCGLGILSWLLMIGFFGFVIYMAIKEEQGGGEPPEAVMVTIGLSFCLNFVLMLAGGLVGIIGVVVPGLGKGWAIAGLILNALPFLLLFGLILIGAGVG